MFFHFNLSVGVNIFLCRVINLYVCFFSACCSCYFSYSTLFFVYEQKYSIHSRRRSNVYGDARF